MFWSRISSIVYRSATIINQEVSKTNPFKPYLLSTTTANNCFNQIRTFKDKDILKLRCNSCYFKKIDDRLWVLCRTHPRHKQRQKIYKEKMEWIVSHVTRTGSYKRKHFQYPHHDL